MRPGEVRRGKAWTGSDWFYRIGAARYGSDGQSRAGHGSEVIRSDWFIELAWRSGAVMSPVGIGPAWYGRARRGLVYSMGPERPGRAGFGTERPGMVRQGKARMRKDWLIGLAWHGRAWLGPAWQGRARPGIEVTGGERIGLSNGTKELVAPSGLYRTGARGSRPRPTADRLGMCSGPGNSEATSQPTIGTPERPGRARH